MTRYSKLTALAVALLGMSSVVRFNAAMAQSSDPGDEVFKGSFDLVTLTINNYLDWCSIAVNSEPPVIIIAPAQFPQGVTVALHAEPNAGFVWGYWTGTDGDTGSGDTNKSTSVKMSTDRAVLACCPFSSSPTCSISSR